MSLHADALRVLETWSAPDEAQEVLRRRYVGHLHARADAMARGCRPDHLTASTVVLDHDASHVLLTLHAKARTWFQLGGHCEAGDETLAAAAQREAGEESGLGGSLDLDPVPVELSEHAVPFCGPLVEDRSEVVHHLDVRFVAVAAPGAAYEVSDESLDLSWWPVDALPAGADGTRSDLTALVSLALARVRERAQSPTWSSGGGSTWAAADQPSR